MKSGQASVSPKLSTIKEVGRTQVPTKQLWVKDDRSSECLTVMVRIGFAVLPKDVGKTNIKPPEREQTSVRCTITKSVYKI